MAIRISKNRVELQGVRLNLARTTVASAATTGDIWTVAGNQIDWTGTATTTAFPNAPQAGTERVLICAGACSFTAGANMLIDGVSSGSTVTCAANDTVIVRAVSTTQFKLSRVKYDGTAQVGSGLSAATQAQAEAGTADTVAITPLSANWHPGVAKVFIECDAAGTINVSWNVTSISDDGTGLVTVTIATDFSTANYVILTSNRKSPAGGLGQYAVVSAIAAGTFSLRCDDGSNGNPVDPGNYFAACFGDQA